MKPHVKYGLLAGLILGVTLFLSMLTMPEKIDMDSPFSAGTGGGLLWWLFKTGALFALFFLSVKESRDQLYGGYLSFGKAFKVSYITSLIAIGVYFLVALVYYYVFNPDWYPISWDQMAESIEENSSGQNIDAALEMAKMWYDHITELVLAGLVIGNAIGLAILSLIVAAIGQKDDPNAINL